MWNGYWRFSCSTRHTVIRLTWKTLASCSTSACRWCIMEMVENVVLHVRVLYRSRAACIRSYNVSINQLIIVWLYNINQFIVVWLYNLIYSALNLSYCNSDVAITNSSTEYSTSAAENVRLPRASCSLHITMMEHNIYSYKNIEVTNQNTFPL